MINRLNAIETRYEEISIELSKAEVITDIRKMTELSKEQRRLAPTVEIYKKYKTILSDIETAKEMLNDKDMQEFAKDEISNLTKEKEQIESDLEILLLPHDPNDEKNVIVEIRGAAGGDEANIFAGDLFDMYNHYANNFGWKIEVLNSEPGAVTDDNWDDNTFYLNIDSCINNSQVWCKGENKGKRCAAGIISYADSPEFHLVINHCANVGDFLYDSETERYGR